MNDPSILPGTPRGGRGRGGSGREAAFSAARGAVLVGLAVVIGIVLLQLIDTGKSGPIGDGGAGAASNRTTTTTVAAGGSSTPSTTSTTTKGTTAVKAPADVVVLVQNGSGKAGAAGAQTDALKAKGYQTLSPADATARTGTVVYFKTGLERECTTVATIVGGDPKVQAMPTPAPVGSDTASCVVILGS